jgi:hypothetical protein
MSLITGFSPLIRHNLYPARRGFFMTCIKVPNGGTDLSFNILGMPSYPPRNGWVFADGAGTPFLNPEMDDHGNQ